jgi:hypothetical protein
VTALESATQHNFPLIAKHKADCNLLPVVSYCQNQVGVCAMASSESMRRNLPLVLRKKGEPAAQKLLAVYADDWKVDALLLLKYCAVLA